MGPADPQRCSSVGPILSGRQRLGVKYTPLFFQHVHMHARSHMQKNHRQVAFSLMHDVTGILWSPVFLSHSHTHRCHSDPQTVCSSFLAPLQNTHTHTQPTGPPTSLTFPFRGPLELSLAYASHFLSRLIPDSD